MLKYALIAASAASLFALPATADAKHRSRYYGGYSQPYYGGSYYGSPYYGSRYYGDRYYGSRYYGDRYYGDRRYGSRYYRRHRDRCGNGTVGLIAGGAAGALLGREIDRGSRRGYYGRRSSGTTGAIVGGALGALVGREIARGC